VVLEDGKIIETGTYATLAAKADGRLRSLIRGVSRDGCAKTLEEQ
jgi:ABC-type multidrug transport system fused ATPase/permease subunit